MDYFQFMSRARRDGQRGRILAAMLRGAWRGTPPELENFAKDLPALIPLVIESGTAPLVWRRVRDRDWLDSRVARELRQAYRHSTIQGDLHEHEIKQVFALLRSVGVEPVLVKGWAAARLYPEAGLRPSGDIDLCLHPTQYLAAEAALSGWTDHQFALDLHEGVSTLDREDIDLLYSRSQLISLGDCKVRVMAHEDHLRILCIHFLRHGAFRPLWLCDIAAAVEAAPDNFDWKLCLGADRRRREWVSGCIRLAHQLLGATLDKTPFDRSPSKLPRWLIPNVLKQWESPSTMNHGVMKHRSAMVNYLRNPAGLLRDILNRWPNPIEATVYTGGPFNNLPRWPFQIGECFSRTAKFLSRLPAAFADADQHTRR